MEISLIYHQEDPNHIKARDYLRSYVRQRGILARIVEREELVKSPTVVINGQTLNDRRESSRKDDEPMYPSAPDIARAIDEHIWSV